MLTRGDRFARNGRLNRKRRWLSARSCSVGVGSLRIASPARGTFLPCHHYHRSGQPSTSHEDVHFSILFLRIQLDLTHLTLGLSATSASRAITKFTMPAMSPTMTEGGIASWKKREGESFTSGDVLLEIVRYEQHPAFGTSPVTCTGNGQG